MNRGSGIDGFDWPLFRVSGGSDLDRDSEHPFTMTVWVRIFIAALISALLTACATWTAGTDRVADEEDLQTFPISRQLKSYRIELRMPEGWVSRDVSAAQRERSMKGFFEHPRREAVLAVYSPDDALTIAAARKDVELRAEERLPGAELSEGPFSLTDSALSPMYVRFSGVTYQDGEIVNRQVYGGYNLSRSLINYVMVMEVAEQHVRWGKRQFISILDAF